MLKSPIQIKEEFKLIQTDHRQLNNFYYGSFLEAMKREDEDGRRLYKYLIVSPVGTSHSKNYTSITYNIAVCDKIRKNLTDRDEVQSDCVQILNDIYSTFFGDRWLEFADVEGDGQSQLFNEKAGDGVAGAVMNLNIKIYSEDNQCAIPYIDGSPLNT